MERQRWVKRTTRSATINKKRQDSAEIYRLYRRGYEKKSTVERFSTVSKDFIGPSIESLDLEGFCRTDFLEGRYLLGENLENSLLRSKMTQDFHASFYKLSNFRSLGMLLINFRLAVNYPKIPEMVH
ncbi:hypothetical protein K0M31_013381, partial [Melipona bicolor]